MAICLFSFLLLLPLLFFKLALAVYSPGTARLLLHELCFTILLAVCWGWLQYRPPVDAPVAWILTPWPPFLATKG